jgi:hypothetical protein
MADKKISQLSNATTPLAGSETVPIVQSGSTVKVPVSDITAGRQVSAAGVTLTGATVPTNGAYLPTTNALAFSTNSVERVRVAATGEVGIGTANSAPRGDLDVGHNSTALTTRSLHIGYSGGNFYGYRATNTNTAGSFGAGDFFLERGTTSAWVTDFSIDDNGNVTIGGGALATTATNRFFYAPTCAGVPTGVPTTKTGFAPVVIDTTNHRLYFYSGGSWRNAGP